MYASVNDQIIDSCFLWQLTIPTFPMTDILHPLEIMLNGHLIFCESFLLLNIIHLFCRYYIIVKAISRDMVRSSLDIIMTCINTLNIDDLQKAYSNNNCTNFAKCNECRKAIIWYMYV